jgi:hypothetical protein
MLVGVTDPISETFPCVMRSNICSAVYGRVVRRAFKLWGEWNLNEGERECLAAKEDRYLAHNLETLVFDLDSHRKRFSENDHAQTKY